MDVWFPPISKKGVEVFNDYHKFLLVEGARKSTKSNSIEHKLMRHALENDGARIGIFVKTKSTGDCGPWNDIIGPGGIIEKWVEGENGIAYAVPPKYKEDSKMAFFRLRTPATEECPYGGEVEVQLHSVFNEDPKVVEARYKSTSFSMIYLCEGDAFQRSTFTFLRSQLRSFKVKSSNFQFIIDANPPEEGRDHWLYEVFFKNPGEDFNRIHFDIDDNDFFTDQEKLAVYQDYEHDKVLLDRYYYGKWVQASTDGIFSAVFLPDIHVVGKIPVASDPLDYEERDDWVILRPDPDAGTIEEGWDIGDVNFGYVMGVPRFHPIHRVVVYDIIDEMCYLNTRIGLNDVVDEVESRREYWQNWQAKQNEITNVRWLSWSDSSSLRHRIGINGTEADEIYRLSGRKMVLKGVKKGSGSVARRKDLLMRLLFERRIYISPLCKNVLAMIRSIKGRPGMAIDLESPFKHVFDALTYMLGYGLPESNKKQERGERPKIRASISLPV